MVSPLFDLAAHQLERHSSLSRLEARGTLRLTLKDAGIDPNYLTPAALRVVFEHLMVSELEARGIADAEAVCRRALDGVSASPQAADAPQDSHPDEVFRRLGGD